MPETTENVNRDFPAEGEGSGEVGANTSNAAPDVDQVRREKDNAFRLLRDRDMRLRQQTERLDLLEAELREMREQRAPAPQPRPQAVMGGEDAEPDPQQDVVGWLQWKDRRDQRQKQEQEQRFAVAQERQAIDSFALASEAAAKAAHPDYDDALRFAIEDYRKELEGTGELDEAAANAMADPNLQKVIQSIALQRGVSELDAARELCTAAAFETRRVNIVKAARRKGMNPAEVGYELARRRGWKGDTQGATRAAQVDRGLAELERKRAMRAGEQSLAEVRGGEPRDKRVYSRGELEELMRTNPSEFRRATREIANMADEGNPADVLSNLITR